MKKTPFLRSTLLIAAVFLFSLISKAQTVELTAAYGYQFGSQLDYGYNSYLKINEGDQYSFTIGVDMFKGTKTEVTWVHQNTYVTRRTNGETKRITDLNADWIMIGASKYFDKDKLVPFVGGGLGTVAFNSINENIHGSDNIDTKWYFAVSLKAGANYMFNENWGINVQGNLMFPVQWGGVYFGTGGSGASLSSTTLIGGFSGGLVYRMK